MSWFGRKPQDSDRIIWGFPCRRGLRSLFKGLSLKMRVPLCVLLAHILVTWIDTNKENIGNADWLEKYGNILADIYLKVDDA